jgi:hypothetical protein
VGKWPQHPSNPHKYWISLWPLWCLKVGRRWAKWPKSVQNGHFSTFQFTLVATKVGKWPLLKTLFLVKMAKNVHKNHSTTGIKNGSHTTF